METQLNKIKRITVASAVLLLGALGILAFRNNQAPIIQGAASTKDIKEIKRLSTPLFRSEAWNEFINDLESRDFGGTAMDIKILLSPRITKITITETNMAQVYIACPANERGDDFFLMLIRTNNEWVKLPPRICHAIPLPTSKTNIESFTNVSLLGATNGNK